MERLGRLHDRTGSAMGEVRVRAERKLERFLKDRDIELLSNGY